MIKKAVKKSFVFLIALIFIIFILNSIFVFKGEHRDQLVQGLYKHTGNSYDVVLMGSSHMNGGVDPNILWKKYGITSYNYATGGQTLDVTYYLLNELLKNHTPKVVVVDIYYSLLTDEYGDASYLRSALDNMKLSVNKVNAVMNSTSRDNWLSFLIPIYEYHYRWETLEKEDIFYNSTETYYEKGFDSGTEKYGKDHTYVAPTNETVSIPSKWNDYINKFIQLSKEKGFKLIFINTPFEYADNKLVNNMVTEPEKMFNTLAEISEKNDIPFINFYDIMDQIGLDFKNDMNNSGHLNIWGANKVTTYLGSYLKQNYKLTDHRGDSKYSDWDKDYKKSEAATILKIK